MSDTIDSGFADRLFEIDHLKDRFENKVLKPEIGITDYGKLGWDYYDRSLEIYEVPNDDRLTVDGVKAILDCGFDKIYVNHFDKWETHYSTRNLTGWRRKRTRKGFEISYWPESWGDPVTGKNAEWLTSGYMTIVPDPLDESPGPNLADATKKDPTP